MSEKLYYVAPSDEIFDEIKSAAKDLWKTYDNYGGYVDEKIAVLDRMTNIRDNWMYIVAMFDQGNQTKLLRMLNYDTVVLVMDAISSVSS